MSQRLTLHIGLPKSGTTYLQGLLASHREELRAAGRLYPFVRPEAMFRAAVEVRQQHEVWGLPPEEVDGTWRALLDRVREVGLPAVISHEILAGCSPEHAARVAADVAGHEVHLVVTCRDLLRQAMGHWQEEVKNGRPWSYDEMVAALPTAAESADQELGFWSSQDLVGVLDRWSAALPSATVHVVTAPPSGSPPDELWRRFAEAAAIPADALDPTDSEPGANRSLGAAQVRFLREVLVALDGRVGQPDHAHVVKRWFAQKVLAERGGEPARATPELAGLLLERSAGWADGLLTTAGEADAVSEKIGLFRTNGGEDKPVYLQFAFSYARNASEARQEAYDQWRSNMLPVEQLADYDRVSQFDEVSKNISVEDVINAIPVYSDIRALRESIQKYLELDIDRLILHNVSRRQEIFIEDYGQTA